MKLITQISFLITIVFFLACSQTVKNSETIDLNLLYTIGDEQTIVSVIETKGNALFSIREEMEATLTVISIEEEVGYTFATDVVRIKYESKMGDEIEKYDSQKKEVDMTLNEQNTHADFKAILDSDYLISIDGKGNITKPFSYKNGGGVSDEILDMNNIQLTFPNEKVGIDSEWEDGKINSITGQKIVSTYKIKDITNEKIIISVKSKIPAIGQVLPANEATGEYELDRATCNLIKAQKEMKLPQGGKGVYTYYRK